VKRTAPFALSAVVGLAVLICGCPVQDPPLVLAFPDTVGEGMAPNPQLVITLPEEVENDVTVAIVSSNPAFLTVPPSVVVPAGQRQVTLDAVSVDNTYLDFNLTLKVTISADGYASAEEGFLFTDNESTALLVSVPATVNEQGPSVTGTVSLQGGAKTRNGLDISLESSDPSAVTVPDAVHIDPDAGSADFDINPQQDDDPESEDVDITASHPQMITGYDTIHVNDDEN